MSEPEASALSTIDAHVHLYPPELNADPKAWAEANGEPRWAELCVRRRKNGRLVQDFPSVDELLRKMDEAAVARAVLLGWYWERAENCAVQNRFYAGCVRGHPDRLSAFATIQPLGDGEAAVSELRRSRDEALVGIGELSPHAQGYGVDSEDFRAVLAQAAAWKWPVNLHVTDPTTGKYPGRVETPLADFKRLARGWPAVTFILAHWGGGLAWDPEGGTLRNVYYDTAASPLLYDASVWLRGVSLAGAGRVLFGSDFPLNLYPRLEAEAEMRRLLAEVRGAGMDQEDLSMIFGGNAAKLFLGQSDLEESER